MLGLNENKKLSNHEIDILTYFYSESILAKNCS